MPFISKIANAVRHWTRPTPEVRRRRILKSYAPATSRRFYLAIGLGILAYLGWLGYSDGGARGALTTALVASPFDAFGLWLTSLGAHAFNRHQRDIALEFEGFEPAEENPEGWRWTKARMGFLLYSAAIQAFGTVWAALWVNYLLGPVAAAFAVLLSIAYYAYLVRKWRRRKRGKQ